MFERRKFVRIPDGSEISYKVLPDSKTKMFVIKDISLGGLRFHVHESIAQNSLLEIRLTLSKIPFSFKTVVKTKWIKKMPYVEGYEVGVEFVNIPQSAAEHLMRYIKHVEKCD